jgi:hypothetical protein
VLVYLELWKSLSLLLHFFFALLPEKVLLSGVISGALLYIRDEFPAVRDNYLLQVQSSLLITARYNMESPHV